MPTDKECEANHRGIDHRLMQIESHQVVLLQELRTLSERIVTLEVKWRMQTVITAVVVSAVVAPVCVAIILAVLKVR